LSFLQWCFDDRIFIAWELSVMFGFGM
jgi:hypothetical protein